MLILSAAFGSGHYQAAESVAQACRDLVPGCQATALNLQHPVLSMVVASYLKLLHYAPSAYRRLYRLQVNGGMRGMIRRALSRRVRQEIRERQPDVVLATHPFPGAVAAHERRCGRLKAPVAMVVTDFIPHALWVCDGVDAYFVPSEMGAETLARLGVAPSKIHVVGIPIRSQFQWSAERTPFADAPREVLVMGGGLGLGPIVEAVDSLLRLPQPGLKVNVVCGANHDLQAELTTRFGADHRLSVLGYTNEVPQLMAQADLLVSKPGGVTCSEALACGLPILLLRPLPGQEEENAQFLTLTGAARVTPETMVGHIAGQLLFGSPETLSLMRQAARMAGRPDAAHNIVAGLVAGNTPIYNDIRQVAN